MMANTSGNGFPTQKTLGAIGDIYTDLSTGQRYKCIFAYNSNGDNAYEWRKIENYKTETEKLSVKNNRQAKTSSKPMREKSPNQKRIGKEGEKYARSIQ